MAYQFYPQQYYPQMQAPQMQTPQMYPGVQSAAGGSNNLNGITPQIQNGGFVSVRSEIEARNYPMTYGSSITFKDENAPFVYTKTMGFSQLDRPVFEKYRLVKETTDPQIQSESSEGINSTAFVLKSEFDPFMSVVEGLKKEVNQLKEELNHVKSHADVKNAEIKPATDSVADV